MPNFIFKVVDATTGYPIGGAAVSGMSNTNPCPMFSSGCTSGNGYSFTGNTDPTGQFVTGISFTCVQDLTFQAIAPGYNPTNDAFSTNYITGDVYIPTIQLTPLQNVSQLNQGAAGASGAAVNAAGQNITSWSTTDTTLLIVAVVGVLLFSVVLVVRKKVA